MKTVHEVSQLTGISVRTLHYYDEIGLLPPASVSSAGYRLYDQSTLARLQQILFFRELDFPLKEIKTILDQPNYDETRTLARQRELLMLKRNRLEGLIVLIDDIMKGENSMTFQEFDSSAIEKIKQQYAEETQQRWGETAAYKTSQKRTASYSKEDWAAIQADANRIFTLFANLRGQDAHNAEVQDTVRQWQMHITKYYYPCSNEILAGLGESYTDDPRFTKNIDAYGEGTAMLMRDAIRIYCN